MEDVWACLNCGHQITCPPSQPTLYPLYGPSRNGLDDAVLTNPLYRQMFTLARKKSLHFGYRIVDGKERGSIDSGFVQLIRDVRKSGPSTHYLIT
ncbi:hypothetical protein J6590_073695 [Homalodisca vitripennis]|nr:hypothetical protein J6590_073695 [Homalodisca vitripennis]